MSDILYAGIAMAAAIAIAVGFYVFAFRLEDEVATAQVLWATGFTYLGLFIVLNFGLERVWFPRPRQGVAPVPPLAGTARRSHMAIGTVEGVIFIIAILLIGTGTSIMGTRGYGTF